jgi:hypothetical protein
VSAEVLGAHEQPPPAPAAGDCWLLVQADMEARRRMGIAKYGTPVQAGNGRRALVDAYDEVLDQAVYLRQEIEERRELDAELAKLREDVETFHVYLREAAATIRDLQAQRDAAVAALAKARGYGPESGA